jgi:serine/threonine protein kinase
LNGVCSALEEAHALKLLHRDLKPANILVRKTRHGEVAKVVDFGLAFTLDAPSEERLTSDNSVMGTPEYMSPEQCRGSELDRRSDLYALGVVLYEMLVGEVPFSGSSRMDTMMKAVLSVPVKPSQRVAIESPAARALEQLALAAISKLADGRPNDAAAFRKQLQRAVAYNDGADTDGAARPVTHPTREARVKAAALSIPPTVHPRADGDLRVCVIEAIGADPIDSLRSMTALVRNESPSVIRAESMADVNPQHFDVLVIALRIAEHEPSPETSDGETAQRQNSARQELRELANWSKPAALVVIGPADFEIMTEALTAGVADYVVDTRLADELGPKLRKTLRRSARKRKS